MSAPDIRPAGVPTRARVLAAQLAALFTRDRQIVLELADAQHRLQGANDRLWSGPGRFAEPGPGPDRALLGALGALHWQIHRAFCDYQDACEQRRQLAIDVGELAEQLTQVLRDVGWNEHQARHVNVHELARAASAAREAQR